MSFQAAVRARAQQESEAVVGKEGEGRDKEASSSAQQVEDETSAGGYFFVCLAVVRLSTSPFAAIYSSV